MRRFGSPGDLREILLQVSRAVFLHVEAANQILLYGRMPAGMKQAVINAAAPGYDAKTRIITVLYLTAISGQYAIQY